SRTEFLRCRTGRTGTIRLATFGMFLLKTQARSSRTLVGTSRATSGHSRTRSRRPSATSRPTWRRREAARAAEAVGEEAGEVEAEGAVAAGPAERATLPAVEPLTRRVPPGIRWSVPSSRPESETVGSARHRAIR